MQIKQTKDEPGEIHYRGRAKQLVNFTGLTFTSPANGSTITPTDIDGLIEYNGEGFIFFDLKYNGADLHYGQRLCFERLIDAIGLPAVFFVADHDVSDPQKDIDAASSIVRMFYFNALCNAPNHSKWILRTGANTTLKNYINRFISRYFTLAED